MFDIDTTNLDCIEEYELYRYINRFTEEVEQRTEEDLLEDVLIRGC
jgi:hypothetical protein